MANNPAKKNIHRLMIERSLAGNPVSWMEGMSLETPDVVEWMRSKLAELITASKSITLPDVRHTLTDIIIDTGVALVKLEKFQKKKLVNVVDENDQAGLLAQKEVQKNVHKKAAKLLASLARKLDDLAYRLQHKYYETQAEIGDAYRESRNESERLMEALGGKTEPTPPTPSEKDDYEERLETLREHMAASGSEEERQLISDIIDYVKTTQTQSKNATQQFLNMLEMQALKITIEKNFLVSIRNVGKLCNERADGWYL